MKGQELVKLERDKRIIELRKENKTYRQIAAEVGISAVACRNVVNLWISALISPDSAEEYRLKLTDDAEEIMQELMPRALAGSHSAQQTWLRYAEFLAKMWGSMAPANTNISITHAQLVDDFFATRQNVIDHE